MNLKEILKLKDFTFTEFAKKLNLSIATISYYNSLKRTPKLMTMQKMSDILEVDLQTIVKCFTKDNKEEE